MPDRSSQDGRGVLRADLRRRRLRSSTCRLPSTPGPVLPIRLRSVAVAVAAATAVLPPTSGLSGQLTPEESRIVDAVEANQGEAVALLREIVDL